MREIAFRMIDEQINSVQIELANMVSGIVQQDAIDNKLYYSVNEDYPLYPSRLRLYLLE